MRLRVTKTVLSFCAAAFATLAFHQAAEANLVEYGQSFIADADCVVVGPPCEDIYFYYYDPSIGTLTGVTYVLESEYDLWLKGIATAPPPNKLYNVESTHYLFVDGTEVFSYTLTASCTTGANGTHCTAEDHSEDVTLELDLFDLLDLTLAYFEGDGTFEFELTTMTEVGGDCSKKAVLCGGSSTMWGGTGYLTYTFDPTKDPGLVTVAEPGTLALFGSGLAGLGFLQRRRKRIGAA